MYSQELVAKILDKVFTHGDGKRTVRGIVSYNKLNENDLLSLNIITEYLHETGWKVVFIMKTTEELKNN